jgi:secreted trypsin-like serine protease
VKTHSSRESSNSTRNSRDADARIVSGIDAKSLEFPFIVAIYKDGHFHCGGSIYNEHWIITAAHCTRNFESHYYEIWVGVLRRSSYSSTAQIVKVSHVIRHEGYEQSTMKNDIALMKVKHHLSFNRWVRPICLPGRGRSSSDDNWKFGPTAGTICSTLGWGAIREKGPDREIEV